MQSSATPRDPSADSLLRAAVQRCLRAEAQAALVVLHLSALLPPAPRPHHRRIARAILNDAAMRHDGQVFAQPSGDLALLCRPDGVSGTAQLLARLFRVDAPRAEALMTLWLLPADAAAVLDYTAQDPSAPVPSRGTRPAAAAAPAASGVDPMDALLATARLSDLVRQQTAIRLDGVIRPIFREMTFSHAVLDARLAALPGGWAGASDPFLFRHLAVRLDERMLAGVTERLVPGGLPVHLNLTLQGVLSAPFLTFAAAIARTGGAAAVELSLVEACADPAAFAQACTRLRAHGFGVVLDGVGVPALLLTRPEALRPDLVKLEWSPRIPAAASRDGRALDAALARIGLDRVVLQRAETEAALAWGMARGIRRFQGRHVDAMLAAGRLGACRFAGGCTLRQCVERASATGGAGRAGCRDLAGLDAGYPTPAASHEMT